MSIPQLLEFYAGKNTQQRQDFIVSNLRVEQDGISLEELDIVPPPGDVETDAKTA